jgi:hypothetical protein
MVPVGATVVGSLGRPRLVTAKFGATVELDGAQVLELDPASLATVLEANEGEALAAIFTAWPATQFITEGS